MESHFQPKQRQVLPLPVKSNILRKNSNTFKFLTLKQMYYGTKNE